MHGSTVITDDVILTVDHKDTIFKVIEKARDKYYFLGEGIGLKRADLIEIENRYLPDKKRCLLEILILRIQQGGLTRSMLCQSLREAERDDVAQEIEDLNLPKTNI